MRLTTIGTGTIAMSPDRVRAGHLVESGPVRLLLDCGSGVTHRMAELGIDWMGITHAAFTHFHADHIADLATLIFAWRHGRMPGRSAPVQLIGPPGFAALVDRLAGGFGPWLSDPGFPLAVRELGDGESTDLAEGVTISARKVPHTDESVAYFVRGEGRGLVYTGDTAFDEELGRWARGCNLLLCECSLPESMAIPTHLTPRQCGVLAALARPERLVLTHFYPPVEEVDVVALVGERFDGAVVVARDGWSVEV